MNSREIVSLRTALRYLRHGDDVARRRRLACILFCLALSWALAISLGITAGVLLSRIL